jgi:hypothetical protein
MNTRNRVYKQSQMDEVRQLMPGHSAVVVIRLQFFKSV